MHRLLGALWCANVASHACLHEAFETKFDWLTKSGWGSQHLSEQALPGLGDGEKDLLHNVETNTKQYLKLFAEAADDCLGQIEPSVPHVPDVYDVLLQQVTISGPLKRLMRNKKY